MNKREKEHVSTSQNVNQRLETQLETNVCREVAEFFRSAPGDRQQRRAFHKAAAKLCARESQTVEQ